MALLSVENLTMTFGSLVANNNVSFDVDEGSIVGLLGPNGAGKTTTFNCISGYYPPTSGKIFLGGQDITRAPAYKVARLGAVRTFQVVQPLKELSVLENVLIGAFLKEKSTLRSLEAANQCIDLCHLGPYRDVPAGELPIGMKKRLEIARTLATRPRLLMLDEAMAGLTVTEIKTAVELILKIRESGITLLVVEHIMEAIMPIADKVVVLDGGEKIAEGPPRTIIEDEKVIKAYFGAKFSKRLQQERQDGPAPA
ncbi:LivG3 [Desulforapulum autotrophicum HRM2]|uniref:LivG3 n=1 Tax=Desulforapulum autotrophicum (strain ATCC 43914 / DSM 3382 / VKM B-1955 / HRM2) TaxID=177437 RepID=C0QDG5_DESAH|nr:ABC transporter ATP-binding protein [Desulforapulum autotrophicum]ACN15229.1 LivG3 [Desulforapulum autotrophicum HRM2]